MNEFDSSNKKCKVELPNVCYRVNTASFHLLKRRQDLVELATLVVNPVAASLVGLIVDETPLGEQSFEQVESGNGFNLGRVTVMSLSTKTQDLQFNVVGNPANKLVHYLDALCYCEPAVLGLKDQKGGGEYAVQFDTSVKGMRQRLVLSILQEHLGTSSCRIWRLLLLKQKLDEKQITKLTLMHEKVVRQLLYQMLKIGMVFIQDVPKSQDHSAARTAYLWFVDLDRTCTLLLQNVYKALNKVKLRRQSELEKRSILLQKTQRTDILAGEAHLSPQELKKLQELESVLKKLHTSQMRLDGLVLKLRDY